MLAVAAAPAFAEQEVEFAVAGDYQSVSTILASYAGARRMLTEAGLVLHIVRDAAVADGEEAAATMLGAGGGLRPSLLRLVVGHVCGAGSERRVCEAQATMWRGASESGARARKL